MGTRYILAFTGNDGHPHYMGKGAVFLTDKSKVNGWTEAEYGAVLRRAKEMGEHIACDMEITVEIIPIS